MFRGIRLEEHAKVCLINFKFEETLEAYKKLRSYNEVFDNGLGTNNVLKKPPVGVVKIHVDGATSVERRMAGIGCVIRNHERAWIGGEERCVGRVGAFTAELYAILFGLKWALDMRIRRMIVESDSKQAVELLLGSTEGSNEGWVIIDSCMELLSRDWVSELNHIPRGDNKAADWVAK